MSDQRMIGEILSERRTQLRLSIDRVASDTKLQPRMIEAFERSDFDAMPPKGYAQATLASYARYLGLEPDDILPLYESQLRRHQREANPSPVRAAQRASTRASLAQSGSARRSARSGRATSTRAGRDEGGYASYDDGYEDGYDDPRGYDGFGYDEAPRSSSRAARSGLYETSSRRASSHSGLYDDGFAGSRGRTSSARHEQADAWRTSGGAGTSAARGHDYGGYGSGGAGRAGTAGGRTGRGRATEQRPTEVVTLDDGYQGGSGGMRDDHRGGGRSSHQVRQDEPAPTIMDNVMGVIGGVSAYFRQNRQMAIIVTGIVAALILVLIIFGITSCASRRTTGDGTIPVTSLGASSTIDSSDGSDAGTASDADAGTDAGTNVGTSVPLDSGIDLANLPANSVLNFLVQPGSTTTPWIEVTVDGAIVFAAQTVAGDTQSFVITRSATITVSDTTDVSLSVNGTPVQATASNGTYSLTATVAADQQPAQDAPVDTGDAAAADAGAGDDAGGEPVGDDGSQGSSGTYAGMPGLEILYDEWGGAYYLDQNGDPNYYYDDGTPVG